MAETLITLAIIGVIAAMTVPTLLNKYQKHTYVVGLKKAYSQLSNAVKMIPLSEGCPAGDFECAGVMGQSVYFDIDDATFSKLLSQNLKAVKYCPYENDTSYKKCFGENYTTKADGYSDDRYMGHNFVLADGTFWTISGNKIVVDLNGAKGPGAYGRDRFWFFIATFTRNGVPQGTIMPYGSKIFSTHANYSREYWRNSNYCTTESVANGIHSDLHCTGRVLEEDAMNY